MKTVTIKLGYFLLWVPQKGVLYKNEALWLLQKCPGKSVFPKQNQWFLYQCEELFFFSHSCNFLLSHSHSNSTVLLPPLGDRILSENCLSHECILSLILKNANKKGKLYLFSKMFATNHDWLVLYVTSTRAVIKVMLALIFTEVKSLWCITPSTPAMTKFAHEINPN